LPDIDPLRSERRTLTEWLAHQERQHPNAIALGLDRCRIVAEQLGLLPPRCITLTVGGTNGKGSSVTLAAEIYRSAGYRVGRYLSPHLMRYNERVAIDGVDASDEDLCAAFEAIEAARGGIPLTYFEYGTLAALWLFKRAACDVQVLEVGLGGRLDAVNIVDADCALVTNIGLDHTDWLGPDLDSIGREKAGIARDGRPLIFAGIDVPSGFRLEADRIGARRIEHGRDYGFEVGAIDWNWWGEGDQAYLDLPPPKLAGSNQYTNAAGVLAAVSALSPQLPIPGTAVAQALDRFCLAGRYQRRGSVILDVAHNAEAAAVLAENLKADGINGRVWLVIGMLSDKPVEAVCATLAPHVRGAFFAGLPSPRGLAAETLAARAHGGGLTGVAADNVQSALGLARSVAADNDLILVCGSFLTVAEAARLLDE